MGDLPLRTPTHRRFGGPLHRQLPNATHAHPRPESLPLTPKGCPSGVPRGIRPDFSGLSPCRGQVAYVLLTRAPVAGGGKQAFLPAAPRLACVKPVASVHPEPGSNSSLLVILFLSFLNQEPRQLNLLSCRPLRFDAGRADSESDLLAGLNRYRVFGNLTEWLGISSETPRFSCTTSSCSIANVSMFYFRPGAVPRLRMQS